MVRDRVAHALALALGDHPLGLDAVGPLPAHVGAGRDHRLLGGGLLGRHLLGVRREAAAVPAHRAVAQLADPLHPLEELAVVADDEQGARPGAEHVVEPRPRRGVEVVGRLVEEQDVGPAEQQPGQPEPDRLAAGQLAEAAVQDRGGQAEAFELGDRSLLDVPLVTDRLEVSRVAGAGVESAQRPQRRTDPEHVVDAARPVEDEVLRQVAHLAGHRHRAGRRPQHTGREPEQRGLAGAVGADQAGPSGGDQQVEPVERDGAVGPGQADGGEGEH